MTLSAGSRLGPYEVLAPLASGGMGEVHLARDLRLDRHVAIKILPGEMAADRERLKRFEKEARSASALNHPNIVTIYEAGSSNGVPWIAMEHVEGETLRALLVDGPLPTKKLLDVATQIAEGLAKAHEAGIVHRDLKPENLMVSRDGYVKILDFGLAKLTELAAQNAHVSPTAIAVPTPSGAVVGTAGYMSPEQASGGLVDYRTDQFALGAILYEMATGSRAFQRKTGAETLVAILKEEPDPISRLAPKAPTLLRWIVERCLAKDPEERYASTRDLAQDLARLRDHLSDPSLSRDLETIAPVRTRRRGLALVAVVALAVGALSGYLLRNFAEPRPDFPLELKRLTFARGSVAGARFAHDPQTIIYAAAWEGLPLDIFTTRADSSESRSLGLPGASLFAVSSSGELAICLNRRRLFGFETVGTLARVPLAGGAPREVLDGVEDADWSPDGAALAVARQSGDHDRIEYPIGNVLYEAPGWVSDIRVSPDGRRVAFIDHPVRGDTDGTVRVVDADGKMQVTGPPARGGMAWSPSGHEVWSSGPGIHATSLLGKTRSVWNSPGGFIQDIAQDGRVLCMVNSSRREIVGFASANGGDRNLTWLDWSFPRDISSDGKTVLFDEQFIRPRSIYLRALDGSPAVRIGEGGSSWGFSPDGHWVLSVRGDEKNAQFTLVPTGAGEQQLLPKTDINLQAAAWFPDGRRILISGNRPGEGSRLFVQDLPNGQPRPITPEGVRFLFHPVSPDGKSIVASGPDHRVAIYPVEKGEPRAVPGLEPDDIPLRWTTDGKSIFVYRPSALPLRVGIVEVGTGRRTLWKEIRPPDPSGVEQVGPIQIAPDESTYVYSYRRVLDDLYLAIGLR